MVEAIRAMDGEYVGGSRVKLGFGKPVATTCVWVDGLTEHTEKQVNKWKPLSALNAICHAVVQIYSAVSIRFRSCMLVQSRPD